MRRLSPCLCSFAQILATIVILPMLSRSATAGEPTASSHSLPAVLVQLPGGRVTADEFRAMLLEEATANPARFGLGESFLRHTLILMESVRSGIPAPTSLAVETRLREQIAAAGEDYEEQMARSNLTEDDLRRLLRETLLLEAIACRRLGLPEGANPDPARVRQVYEELWKKAEPTFHGLGVPNRAATVGGVNFTAAEVLNFLVHWGPDRALTDALERLVTRKLIRKRAREKGVDLVGRGTEELLGAILAPELTPEKLRSYYAEIRAELVLQRAAQILCAFDRRPGRAYRPGTISEEAEAKARMRAQALRERLRTGKVGFEELARAHSDCPSASSGGNLGYLADSSDIRLGLPAAAYALDTVRTPQGMRSPLRAPPLPEILEAARRLQPGAISDPIHTEAGYVLVKCIQKREPRGFEPLEPFLRRRRFFALREALLQELLNKGVRYAWRPADRIR